MHIQIFVCFTCYKCIYISFHFCCRSNRAPFFLDTLCSVYVHCTMYIVINEKKNILIPNYILQSLSLELIMINHIQTVYFWLIEAWFFPIETLYSFAVGMTIDYCPCLFICLYKLFYLCRLLSIFVNKIQIK